MVNRAVVKSESQIKLTPEIISYMHSVWTLFNFFNFIFKINLIKS